MATQPHQRTSPRKRKHASTTASTDDSESPPQKKYCADAEFKVFNDPIHGHIKLHPLLIKIINTPQFQRLRHISQLGGVYFVYPGASHNRFEHSLGVAHLAGKLIRKLKVNQPDLVESKLIDDRDELCVEIAGLCHDLGHGPFSHLWDRRFIKGKMGNTKWEHEQGSVKMLHHLIEENDLKDDFEEYGLEFETDIRFIEEMIDSVRPTEEWTYKGRDKEKSFLYDIIANKRNGVDVDKWDYFKRDCYHLGIACSFDIERAMEFARIVEVKGERQICFRDKEVTNMYQMFETRLSLHRSAYQHRTSNAVEIMLTEALALANPYVKVPGKKDAKSQRTMKKMSDCIDDMHAYTNLTDNIVSQILTSSSKSKKVDEAQKILTRVQKRDLYKCIGQIFYSEDIEKRIAKEMVKLSSKIKNADLCLDVVKFDYGFKGKNPVDHINFFTKDKPDEAEPMLRSSVSMILPGEPFSEKLIRIYCKSKAKVEAAKECFLKWCNTHPNDAEKVLPLEAISPYTVARAGKKVGGIEVAIRRIQQVLMDTIQA